MLRRPRPRRQGRRRFVLRLPKKGRMHTKQDQRRPEVDQTGAVELQKLEGGATCRGPADDPRTILAPAEVIAPALPAWMEKGNQPAGRRIPPLRSIALFEVTSQASQGQVLEVVWTPQIFRNDVVDREDGGRGEHLRAAAIFAKATRASANEPPQPLPHPPLRHRDLAGWNVRLRAPLGDRPSGQESAACRPRLARPGRSARPARYARPR
jgi:hypothetical protein